VNSKLKPYFQSNDDNFSLIKQDTFKALDILDTKFDMVFADPPYFLSNDGLTIKNGKVVSVNKGDWDKSNDSFQINEFNRRWLSSVRNNMKDNATIWASGTSHNIFSVGQILTELGFKILNVITWEKTNPPPNFSCRSFTHSTEQIIWARKEPKVPHHYNYSLMKELNNDKQMKDVWRLPAIAKWEKNCGKHPTQKPLALLTRIILSSTKVGDCILDPFTGSSTTGIAANLLERSFVGIDDNEEYLELSKNRKIDIKKNSTSAEYISKIRGFEVGQLQEVINKQVQEVKSQELV
jgi:site-specific DNA-methyltransferase (adenine-specific)